MMDEVEKDLKGKTVTMDAFDLAYVSTLATIGLAASGGGAPTPVRLALLRAMQAINSVATEKSVSPEIRAIVNDQIAELEKETAEIDSLEALYKGDSNV